MQPRELWLFIYSLAFSKKDLRQLKEAACLQRFVSQEVFFFRTEMHCLVVYFNQKNHVNSATGVQIFKPSYTKTSLKISVIIFLTHVSILLFVFIHYMPTVKSATCLIEERGWDWNRESAEKQDLAAIFQSFVDSGPCFSLRLREYRATHVHASHRAHILTSLLLWKQNV